MNTRQQRADFIKNSVGLTNNQRAKIMTTNMNINTIRKLLNKVKGKQNRSVLLSGLINRYKKNKNEFYKFVNRQPSQGNSTSSTSTPSPSRSRTTVPTARRVSPSPARTRALQAPTRMTNTETTPRAKRVGAGLSPSMMISPDVLHAFYLLVDEYRNKKSYLGGEASAKLRERFEEYDKYLKDICNLSKFKPTKSSQTVFKSYEPWLDLIREEICASNVGNFKYPNQTENDSRVEELISKCFTDSFEKLFSKTSNNTGRNADVYLKIQSEHIRLLSSIKDKDASSALRLYVIRNNPEQSLNAFLGTLNQNGDSVKALKKMKNEYKLLFSKLRHTLTNKHRNKLNPIPVAVNHGPANHNTLSQSSMSRILKNPRVLDAFAPGSLFAYFINRAIDTHGAIHIRANKCSLRGNIDECLLRRRVVFADIYSTSAAGNKAAQTAISAVNHGRMHRLKALPNKGNTKMPGSSVFKTFNNTQKVRSYINAMKSPIVRNSAFFKNGRSNWRSCRTQSGNNRWICCKQ